MAARLPLLRRWTVLLRLGECRVYTIGRPFEKSYEIAFLPNVHGSAFLYAL